MAQAGNTGTARLLGRQALTASAILILFFVGYEVLEREVFARHLSVVAIRALHTLVGVTASLVLGAVATLSVLRMQREQVRLPVGGLVNRADRQRRYLEWFIGVRWIAVAITAALAIIVSPILHIVPLASLPWLLGWCAALALANLGFLRLLRKGAEVERLALLQIALDLIALTGLLNASGGLENPLYVLYLFHVFIAGILLSPRRLAAVTTLAGALVSFLAVGELWRVLPHFEITVFPHHLVGEHAAHDPLFVAGRLLPFLGILLLAAYVTTVAMWRVRQSEGDLENAAAAAILEHERLVGVIDAAALGMLTVSANGTVAWANSRALEQLEWGIDVVGAPCPHEHDGRGCLACLVAVALSRSERVETEGARLARAGGTARSFRHVATPIRGSSLNVDHVVLLTEEVTARKALEAEALHAAKLSTLGTMAAGVAHEIGNPLASLQTRLALMRRRQGDEVFQRASLGILEQQLGRIAGIVRSISRFARRRDPERALCDLGELADEAVKLVRLDPRSAGAGFRLELATDLPLVVGVRDQLMQVLLNILLNALEAMSGHGTVTVSTHSNGEQVVLAVADSGPGIDPALRERLFTAFASTKRDGSGLGLFICQSLVHAHGGSIEVEEVDREAPGGATFRLRLPAAAAALREVA